jgi:CRISPR-associated protein Cas2
MQKTIRFLLYDIRDDRSRAKVAKRCKQLGLYRVQLSVFLGTLADSTADELALEIEDLIDPDCDKVYLFKLSKLGLKQTIVLGQGFDQRLVTDRVQALFV